MLLLQMKKFSLSSKNLGTKETSNLSLTWLLIKCTNHEEPLLQSSISVYMGKSLVLIRSDSQEDKYYGMRDSLAYKTYLAFAAGAATPKKVRKFKKHVSLSKKKALVAVEEPIEKPFKKCAAKRQSANEAQLKKAIKRSKREKNIHQARGSCEGADFELEGDSDDDNDDDKQSNDERSKYDDDDKAADINKTDDGEEDNFVNAEHEEVSQEVVGDQVKDDTQAKVTGALATQKTKTSPLLTVPVTVIPETSSAQATTIPPLFPPFIPILQQSTLIPTPTATEATISNIAATDSTTLTAIHQRLSAVETKVKTLRNVDHSSAIRAAVKSEVPTVVKEYLGTSMDDGLHNAL
ncbi:hypothetical protein Tco_1463800 [Tanacetum coccineum]